MGRTSWVDKGVELMARRTTSRVPFRAPSPPFDRADVFEGLGLDRAGPPDVKLQPSSWKRRPPREVVPFAFPSLVELEWPRCNTVHGELSLVPGRRSAPVCILIHGNGARSPFYERWRARPLLQAGVHVARFCWAGHMERVPVGERPAEHTLAADLHGCVQTFVQAASDAAQLVRWLRAQPFTSQVGMAGWSGGGLITMLAMTLVHLDFALPVVPAVDLGWTLWGPYIPRNAQALIRAHYHSREELQRAMCAIAPAERKPRLPDRFHLLAGSCDEVCGTTPVRQAWEAWGRPRIEWVRRGHIIGAVDPIVGRRLVSVATAGSHA